MTEIAFEKYRPPGFFIAKEATLASYASGRATSLVVDAGHGKTTVTAVHDGYVLQNCMRSLFPLLTHSYQNYGCRRAISFQSSITHLDR